MHLTCIIINFQTRWFCLVGAAGNCCFHYHVSGSEKSSCSLGGFCRISCCCLPLRIPASACLIVHVPNSFCILFGACVRGLCCLSPVMFWDGPLQMAGKWQIFPMINMKNGLTMCAGVYWCGKVLACAVSLTQKHLRKWFASMIFSAWNGKVNIYWYFHQRIVQIPF